jgi:hypothetical protein
MNAGISDLRSSGMTTHVNKVHHVTTITHVAKDLGEDEDWLRDIAIEMEIEDGVIWVYGVGEDGVKAFTDSGIENLIELIRFYKEKPRLLRRRPCGLRRMDTDGVAIVRESPGDLSQEFMRASICLTARISRYHAAAAREVE